VARARDPRPFGVFPKISLEALPNDFYGVATAIEKLNSRTLLGHFPKLFKALSTGHRI